MKKLLLVLMASMALSACSDKVEEKKEDVAVVASSTEASTTESSAPAKAPEPTVAENAAIPAPCQEYIETMNQITVANPDMAVKFKEAIKNTQEQWATMPEADKKNAEEACKQANEELKLLATAK